MANMDESKPWYEQDDSEAASAGVARFFQAIETWRERWIALNYALVSMYERALWQVSTPGIGITESAEAFFEHAIRSGAGPGRDRHVPPSHNLAKTASDVLAARLFAEQPRLDVVTDGGDYLIQLLARRKTWALRATLDTMASRRALLQFYRDGLQTGFGAVEPMVQGGSYVLDRVTLEELWWHPEEARTCRTTDAPPRTMHRVRRLSKGQAIAMIRQLDIPDTQKDELTDRVERMRADRGEQDPQRSGPWSDYDRVTSMAVTCDADMVTLVRSIRLPSSIGDGESDGRELLHIRPWSVRVGENMDASDGVVLWDGPWERETHPWVWWTPYPAHFGLIGQGIGHVARPYQSQIDRAWPRIEGILRQFGLPKIAYDAAAEDELDSMAEDDAIVFVKVPPAMGAAMKSMNRPYEVITHEAVSAQLLDHPGRVAGAMFSALGVNEGVAMGGSALGANASGAALNAEDTRADVRFSDVLLEADAAHVAIGQETLNALDDAIERDAGFRVRFRDAWGSARAEAWSEIRLGAGAYTVQLEQTGALGRTPAARMRAIQELAQIGGIDAPTAMRAIYRDRDQTQIEELATSAVLEVEWSLYYLALNAEKGPEALAPYWPDEITDLDIAERRSRAELARAKREGASDAVMAVLITYRAQVQAQRKAQQPAPQAVPAMPVDQGAGMPPVPPEPSMAGGIPPELMQ